MRNFSQRSAGPGFGLGFPGASSRRPNLTYALIAINVVVLIAMELAGGSTNNQVLIDFGAMFGPSIADGQYWRLFTAMFLHVGVMHLAFNMFGLFIFGRMVEGVFGPYRFALLYILSGLFGSVISYLLSPIAIAAGASGALFGIIGVMAAYFAVQREVLGRMAQQNLYGLLILGAINLVFGLLSPGIDNWAHMGGFVAGFGLGYAFAPEYNVVRSVVGGPMGMTKRAGQWLGRLWVVPLAIVVLALGVWAGNSSLPATAATYVNSAEQLMAEEDFEAALAEIDRAFELREGPSVALGRAYYVRGQLRVQSGDVSGAKSDLGIASRLADGQTKQAARALLVQINSES